MIITMSDYLLEQEISTASCNDIALEQAYAEMEVAKNLWQAYCKQLVMLEYAYTEAEDAEKKSSGDKWYQKAWEAIKKFFIGIAKWIKEKFQTLKDFFKKTKTVSETAAKKLEDDALAAQITATFNKSISQTNSVSTKIAPKTLVAMIRDDDTDAIFISDDILDDLADAADMIANGDILKDAEYQKFNEIYQDLLDANSQLEAVIKKATERGDKEVTVDQLRALFGKQGALAKIMTDKLDKEIMTLNAVIAKLHNADLSGSSVITKADGTSETVVGTRSNKDIKILESWRKALETALRKFGEIADVLKTTIGIFYEAITRAEKDASPSKSQEQLKAELKAKYNK